MSNSLSLLITFNPDFPGIVQIIQGAPECVITGYQVDWLNSRLVDMRSCVLPYTVTVNPIASMAVLCALLFLLGFVLMYLTHRIRTGR